MHPEVQELQSKLKEILYDCAVDVKATKAALYLSDPEGRFELVTEYGFRGAIRATAERNDPMLERCWRGRTPFFVNGLAAEPRFSELLYDSATDRLLGAPIYLRGHLVGVIDMRDKAGRAPFEAGDLPKAQRIAERIAELFATKNVFGQRFITLSETNDPAARPATPPAPPRPAAPPQTAPAPAPAPRPPVSEPPPPDPRPPTPESRKPSLASLIVDARKVADQLIGNGAGTGTVALGDAELGAARDVLKAMLLLPGVSVAALAATSAGLQEVAARAPLSDEASAQLQSKLSAWLAKRGENAVSLRTNVVVTPGSAAAPLTAGDLQKVFTAPVVAANLRGLYLTVAFSVAPERATHELLAAFHAQLQLAIEHAVARQTSQPSRMQMAAALVEPDFTRYPELRRHSDAVVARAEAFARFLGMGAAEAETVRVVALVHDVGMRLLDYDRLYNRRDLSHDELQILREHVAVGAALVEPFLGAGVARAVLCHHERWDGRGYPNNIAGDEIPRESRIVQLCDVWETMIAGSYAPAEPPDKAAATIAGGIGSQFDPDLAQRFLQMVRKG